MAHPIHEASENSPYGNLAKGEFYQKHQIFHQESSESGWLFELNAVAIARSGFFVCALDLQGHGLSEGPPDHITDVEPLVHDCLQYFDSGRANHPKIPHFLYGESLGAAIAILICLCGHWRNYSLLPLSLHHLGGYQSPGLLQVYLLGRIGRESWQGEAQTGGPVARLLQPQHCSS